MRNGAMNSEIEDSDVDDIDEFADSGEDWTPDVEADPGRKRSNRSIHNNSRKRRKRSTTSESEEVEEDEEEDDGDVVVEVPIESDQSIIIPDEVRAQPQTQIVGEGPNLKDIPREFHSGNFIIQKKDICWEDDKVVTSLMDIVIWKIDGKALLQKFTPFESNGRILHKSTCVYSGWNPESRDKYYAVSQLLDRSPVTDVKEVCVALRIDDLIKVKDNN